MNKKYFLIVILFLFILTIVVGLYLGFKQRGYEQTIASPSPVVNVVNPSVEPANNVTGTIDYDPSNIQQLPSKQKMTMARKRQTPASAQHAAQQNHIG